MTQEGFCPKHGPYDAWEGSCPYCRREGRSVADDDVDTRVYSGPGRAAEELDDMVTQVGGGPQGRPLATDEEQTVVHRRWRSVEAEDVDETVVERAPVGLMGWLIVCKGARRGHIYRLGKQTTIGRRGTNIVLNDPKVSELHAKISIRNDQFVIVDVLSTNGTHVNGEQIQGERVLQENDRIRVGDTVMVLKTLPPETD